MTPTALAATALLLVAGQTYAPAILTPPSWVPQGEPEQEEAIHFACVKKHEANSTDYWKCVAKMRRGEQAESNEGR